MLYMKHIHRLKSLKIIQTEARKNANNIWLTSELNWFFCIGLLHRGYKNYLNHMPVEMILFFLTKDTGNSAIDDSLKALRKSTALLSSVMSSKKLSPKIIFSAHSKLTSTKKSKYRKNNVTLSDRKGEINYSPVPYQAINKEMARLIDWFNAQTPSIERSIIFFWLFVNIHPFEDGNGRAGRLLAVSGLNSAEMHIISLYLAHAMNRFKQNYLVPMNCLQRNGDIKPLEVVSNRSLIKFSHEIDHLHSILIEYKAIYGESCRRLAIMDSIVDSEQYEKKWNNAGEPSGIQLTELKEKGLIEEIEIDGLNYMTMKKIVSKLEDLRKSVETDL